MPKVARRAVAKKSVRTKKAAAPKRAVRRSTAKTASSKKAVMASVKKMNTQAKVVKARMTAEKKLRRRRPCAPSCVPPWRKPRRV